MNLSTAYYEGFRSALLQYLNENSDLSFHTTECGDQSGLNVQSTYTIEINSKKSYVINLYHTKSSILVNGAGVVQQFVNNDLPCIQAILNKMTIDGHAIDWSSLNNSIREALAATTLNSMSTESGSTQVKSLTKSESPPMSITNIDLDSSFNSTITLCTSLNLSPLSTTHLQEIEATPPGSSTVNDDNQIQTTSSYPNNVTMSATNMDDHLDSNDETHPKQVIVDDIITISEHIKEVSVQTQSQLTQIPEPHQATPDIVKPQHNNHRLLSDQIKSTDDTEKCTGVPITTNTLKIEEMNMEILLLRKQLQSEQNMREHLETQTVLLHRHIKNQNNMLSDIINKPLVHQRSTTSTTPSNNMPPSSGVNTHCPPPTSLTTVPPNP
jgi:hypothetical protein